MIRKLEKELRVIKGVLRFLLAEPIQRMRERASRFMDEFFFSGDAYTGR